MTQSGHVSLWIKKKYEMYISYAKSPCKKRKPTLIRAQMWAVYAVPHHPQTGINTTNYVGGKMS
jgi:hypothetical protein